LGIPSEPRDGRDKLRDGSAPFENGHRLAGLGDLIEDREALGFEFGGINFSHVTNLHD
jgi:hypothetical protein